MDNHFGRVGHKTRPKNGPFREQIGVSNRADFVKVPENKPMTRCKPACIKIGVPEKERVKVQKGSSYIGKCVTWLLFFFGSHPYSPFSFVWCIISHLLLMLCGFLIHLLLQSIEQLFESFWSAWAIRSHQNHSGLLLYHAIIDVTSLLFRQNKRLRRLLSWCTAKR